MKPRKVTDVKRARLLEVARLKASTPAMKELAIELNLTEMYTRQLVSQMVRLIRHESDVSHGTIRSELNEHPRA